MFRIHNFKLMFINQNALRNLVRPLNSSVVHFPTTGEPDALYKSYELEGSNNQFAVVIDLYTSAEKITQTNNQYLF